MLDDEIRKILTEELEALRQRIGDNMEAADQIATGRTRDGMRVEVRGLAGVLTGRRAFATLERGSRPWSKKSKRVPKFFADLIGEWIDAKGLDLNKWAVAHSIMTKGSKLYRSGGRTDIYSNELPKTMDAIGKRVLDGYAVLITNRLTLNNTTTIS